MAWWGKAGKPKNIKLSPECEWDADTSPCTKFSVEIFGSPSGGMVYVEPLYEDERYPTD